MLSLAPSSVGMKPAICKHASFTNIAISIFTQAFLLVVSLIWVVVVLVCSSSKVFPRETCPRMW